MSLNISGSVWESSSFGGTSYSTILPVPQYGIWKGNLPIPYDTQISSSTQISTTYFPVGDASFNYSIGSLILSWSQNTDIVPGPISSINYATIPITSSSLLVNYTNIVISYQLISGSLRRGIYANQISGSPQLSLEPLSGNLTEAWAGDILFLSSSQYSGSMTSLRVVEEIVSSSISASTTQSFYTTHVTYPLMGRIEESSSTQVFNRFGTYDRPINTLFAANSYVTDGWFETINTTAVSGTGWKNVPWGGGIYMPDSGTVGIYGNKIFNVSSGQTIFSSSLYTWPAALGLSGTILSQDGAGNLAWVFVSGSSGGSSISSSYALTSSYALVAQTLVGTVVTASYAINASNVNGTSSGSHTGSFTGSLLGNATSASFVSGSYTAQWALSASYAPDVFDGIIASGTIGQFVFYSGSQVISGTALMGISGSMLVLSASTIQHTGSFEVSGNTVFAGKSYTWPLGYGISGTFLSQDGAGNLAWSLASGSSGGIPVAVATQSAQMITAVAQLNFTGPGVTVTAIGNTASINVITGSGGGGGLGSRTTSTTPSFTIASGTFATGSFVLAKSFGIQQIGTNFRATRMRIYTSQSFRDLDVNRSLYSIPAGNHGLITDVYFPSGSSYVLFDVSPAVLGFTSDSTVSASFTIDNYSTGSALISMSVTYIQLES